MSGNHRLLAAAAAASLLTGCAALPASTANHAHTPPATPGHTANGLAYSTASAGAVQPMPAPGTCHYRGSGLFAQPDPRCGPGALNPAVTQANLKQTICRPGGYTRSVRPPKRVTEPEKRALMAAYGNTAPLSTVQLDHIISLSADGAVNDAANLYPEPDYRGVSPDSYYHNPKDKLEERLFELVCRGHMSLARAQAALAHDWPAAYRRYVP
jgi:hypothetical protein